LAKKHSYKVKYQAALTMGITSSTYIDFKGGKRCEVASCPKTEPTDDTEQEALQKASV